jgi:hypothetical protein
LNIFNFSWVETERAQLRARPMIKRQRSGELFVEVQGFGIVLRFEQLSKRKIIPLLKMPLVG